MLLLLYSKNAAWLHLLDQLQGQCMQVEFAHQYCTRLSLMVLCVVEHLVAHELIMLHHVHTLQKYLTQ